MSARYLLAVVLTAATALSASAQAKDKDKDRDRGRDRDTDSDYASRVDTIVPLGRNGAVEIRLHTGDIIVTGWTRSEVRVRGTSERGEIRVEATASRVEIGTHPEHSRHGEATIEITVPEGTRVTVGGSSADVAV